MNLMELKKRLEKENAKTKKQRLLLYLIHQWEQEQSDQAAIKKQMEHLLKSENGTTS